jgi:hypothetical protein
MSRAALTLDPGVANIELGVFSALTADQVRGSFTPPGVDAVMQSLESLQELTFESDDSDEADPQIRLTRATLIRDGKIQVVSEPTPEAGWLLADHQATTDLQGSSSNDALTGPLVRLEAPGGEGISNWAVIEDPIALSGTLQVSQSHHNGHPRELTRDDLETPLGRALDFLQRTLVLDVSEIPTAGSGQGGVDNDESAAGADDDNLWDRLERETLGRDPRAGAYGRLLANRGPADPLTNSIVQLLELMRDQAPQEPQWGTGHSVLGRLISEHKSEELEGTKVTWSPTARLRVRTRNVLRRWAAAQTDPRLLWVSPLAPLGNLEAVASVFANLYLRATGDTSSELEESDMDDLWARWFIPFVHSEGGGGWLNHAGLSGDDLTQHLSTDFVDLCSALCWLAIRPGSMRRERRIHWKPALSAALDLGLISDGEEVAEYVSIITNHEVSASQLSEDFLETIDFMDDQLWCDSTAESLGLGLLDLEQGSAESSPLTRVTVGGMSDPLHDPRLVRLVLEVQAYRRADAAVVHGLDGDWRIVIRPDQPMTFLPNLDTDAIDSAEVGQDEFVRLAQGQSVLADLFPNGAEMASM